MTTNEQYQNAVEYVRKAFKSLNMEASELQVHATALRVIQATALNGGARRKGRKYPQWYRDMKPEMKRLLDEVKHNTRELKRLSQ